MNGQVWMVFSLVGYVCLYKAFYYLLVALHSAAVVLNFKLKLYDRAPASDIFF
jgi:hypothetical protein